MYLIHKINMCQTKIRSDEVIYILQTSFLEHNSKTVEGISTNTQLKKVFYCHGNSYLGNFCSFQSIIRNLFKICQLNLLHTLSR